MTQPIYAVLDTNVLVSALMSKTGVPAMIYEMVHNGKLIPVYDDNILDEYKEVLYRPKLGLSHMDVDALMKLFAEQGKRVVSQISEVPLPDEADRIFYDAASQNGAMLITGNLKHFPQEPFIMAPRDFYEVHST